MKRFQAHQVNELILSQARYIQRGIVYGVTTAVAGVLVLWLGPAHWLVMPLAITALTFGIISIALGLLMLGRMPDLAEPDDASDVLRFDAGARPMIAETRQRVLVFSLQRANVNPAQWACIRATVRRDGYYMSRDSLRRCNLSNEQYRDLRAELIRCGVLPQTGNQIVNSEQARDVFSPAPSSDTGVYGPSRTDDGVSYA